MYSEVLEFMLMISLKLFGEGTGNPLQYSCLENPMDGGAWWATVHGVAKGRTRLSDFTLFFSNGWTYNFIKILFYGLSFKSKI